MDKNQHGARDEDSLKGETPRPTAALILLLLISVVIGLAGYTLHEQYNRSPRNIHDIQEPAANQPVPATPPIPAATTSTIMPIIAPSETPTPVLIGKPATLEYSIGIVSEYPNIIGPATFYIPTPDWNISYWGNCGGDPTAKVILNVYSLSWRGGPVQSITFNNTGGEYFIMHGGPGFYSLRLNGVFCSPITVRAFRVFGMHAQFLSPMLETTPFTIPASDWKITFEVSGDPTAESQAMFNFAVHREKGGFLVREVIFNKYGREEIIIPTGWDSYYLKINSSNCKWKITVTVSL